MVGKDEGGNLFLNSHEKMGGGGRIAKNEENMFYIVYSLDPDFL